MKKEILRELYKNANQNLTELHKEKEFYYGVMSVIEKILGETKKEILGEK